MWWVLGAACVLAMGVVISEFLAVRQVENRIRRKWRDHNGQKRKTEGLVSARAEEGTSAQDNTSQKMD